MDWSSIYLKLYELIIKDQYNLSIILYALLHFIKEKKKMGFAANREIKCKNSIKKWINIYISNNVFIEKVRDLKQF